MEILNIGMAAAGTIVGAVGAYLTQKKKDKRDDFAELLKGHNELYNTVKRLYDETKQREDRCEENLAKLKEEMIIIQSEIADMKRQMK